MHVSTNGTIDKDVEEIADKLLIVKMYVEDPAPDAKVIISSPTIRNDYKNARKTIHALRRASNQLDINYATNDNITEEQLGKSGLHLSVAGFENLAMNYITFIWHL